MNKLLYKPLFVFIPVILLLALAGVGEARDVLVTASSTSECRYTVRFETDLSDLSAISADDSTTIYRDVHFVAVPSDGSARLTRLEGRDLATIAAGSRSLVSAAQAAEPLARLGQPVTVRGRKLVPVLVSPIDGGGVYREVEIAISISGGNRAAGMAVRSDPWFDRVFGSRVVNLDIARTWSKSSAGQHAPQDSPFGDSDEWYRIEVSNTGLHRITGAELQAAGVSLSGLSSNSIRLFNGGGLPLPVLNEEATPELAEIAIRIDDGGDGLFGAADRLFFFGEAVDRWTYAAGFLPLYQNNVYDTKNVYWLTTSGSFSGGPSRMATMNGAPGGLHDTTITTFTRRIRSEQDNLLLRQSDGHVDSYYRWYWTDATHHEFFVPTAGYIAGESARVSVDGYSISATALSVNSIGATKGICNQFNCEFTTTALSGGLDRFAFDLQNIGSGDVPYFDFVELTFAGTLLPVSGRLDARLEPTDGLARIEVTDNFTSTPMVFDLADPMQPVMITGASRTGGAVAFDYTLSAAKVNRVYLATAEAAYAPDAIQSVSITDLRAQLSQTDMIVVTPRTFVDDVESYVDYRAAQGHSIKVVAVEDIMANFGYGLYDPTAIRNYLKFAYQNFTAPAPYVALFVGDGNYDYLDHLQTGQPNYVPSYIHSLSADRTYGDDNYVYFGDYGVLDADTSWIIQPDRGFDMMTARWPVSSASEIQAIVEKISGYESSEEFGSWRNRLTIVADDENNPDRVPFLEPFHVDQAETLLRDYTPSHFETQKIYLWDFPYANAQKPTCNDAIVGAINSGTVLVDYIGHGNPDVWSHERVFTRGSDLPRLTNRDRLPLIFAASCAIGFFDDPKREGMAEDLLAMPNSGAVGVVSATRLVYSAPNAQFNRQVFTVLFGDDDLSICESLFLAKVLRQYGSGSVPSVPGSSNDRAYVYFGDPFTKLGDPRYSIEFSTTPDSLTALGRSQVAGRVVDNNGQPMNVNGSAEIRVFDSDRRRSYVIESIDDTTNYSVTGPSVYRGSAEIVNGQFTFEFITPLDIGIGGTGARISVYGVAGDVDAIGVVDSLPVSSVVTPTSDSSGPEIIVSIDGRDELVDGEAVGETELLTVTLVDSSGINLASGLGHGITLEIDGDVQSTQNLSDEFSYQQNDFTTGSLQLGVGELEPGMHTLKIKAWDNANNSASISFAIEVVSTASLAIQDLLNYPNPMADSTTFFFELTQSTSEFDLEIFTLAGRKIKSIRRFGLPIGSHRLAWDGRDGDGDRIATGVYIYKASARSSSDGRRVESFGKVVVIN